MSDRKLPMRKSSESMMSTDEGWLRDDTPKRFLKLTVRSEVELSGLNEHGASPISTGTIQQSRAPNIMGHNDFPQDRISPLQTTTAYAIES